MDLLISHMLSKLTATPGTMTSLLWSPSLGNGVASVLS